MGHRTRMRMAILSASLPLFLASAAAGALELVDQQTKTVGATTVSWDSSFEDLDYAAGDAIALRVHWAVDAGSAAYSGVRLRGPEFTPMGPDAADGELLDVSLVQDTLVAGEEGAVDVSLAFTELHCDESRAVRIGNAHLSLDLVIDVDGDGTLDHTVAYGFNVHVEEPGECTRPEAGRPPNAGGPPRGRPARGGLF